MKLIIGASSLCWRVMAGAGMKKMQTVNFQRASPMLAIAIGAIILDKGVEP